LFKKNFKLATGLDGDDVQFAIRLSPGSYLSLSVTITGFDFGSSETKQNIYNHMQVFCSRKYLYWSSIKWVIFIELKTSTEMVISFLFKK